MGLKMPKLFESLLIRALSGKLISSLKVQWKIATRSPHFGVESEGILQK